MLNPSYQYILRFHTYLSLSFSLHINNWAQNYEKTIKPPKEKKHFLQQNSGLWHNERKTRRLVSKWKDSGSRRHPSVTHSSHYIGPKPMQLVVPSAVKNAVSAATITFTASSIIRCFFIISLWSSLFCHTDLTDDTDFCVTKKMISVKWWRSSGWLSWRWRW